MQDNKSFQVSVKGLVFNEEGKVLALHERKGVWDLPGGRLEHGESFSGTLERECKEELGVNCRVVDTVPMFAYSAQDSAGTWRLMLFFRIELDSFDFVESDECVEHRFVSKEDFNSLNFVSQTKKLKEWL